MEQLAAFVAIDWSDTKHDICLVDVAIGQKESLILKHTPEELAAWATVLCIRFSGRLIAVCLEQSRGPLIYALLTYDFWVLYPMNPTTLAKYREALSPSRAKDDPRDADYLLERLVQHRDRPKAWRPDNAKTRTLQYLVEYRRRLVNDRPRLSNRMTALLKASFPQIFHWFDDIRTLLVCDVLRRWPTVQALKKVRPATLEKFFHEHHLVRRETIACRIAAIKDAVPLTTDQAVMHVSGLMINAFATQMKTTIVAIRAFDHEIAQLCSTHED